MRLKNALKNEKQSEHAGSSEQRSIGNTLLDCLHARGLAHIFGIPGDYVLRLDKLIEQHQIQYINGTSENSAGYMADAYARLCGLGAVCITYGVGITIVNAVSQAFVESSPIVIISGAPGMGEYANGQKLHHLFNSHHLPGVREHFQLDIFRKITVDQIVLDDPSTAYDLIERALSKCLAEKKPVYIELPRDKVLLPVSIESKRRLHTHEHNEHGLEDCFKKIANILNQCQRPIIWAGHEIQRYGVAKEMLAFAEKCNIPIVSSLMGKTAISERHPLFIGVYQGAMSLPSVREFVENCDCVLQLGLLGTDVETGIFTANIQHEIKIRALTEEIIIGKQHIEKLPFIPFMQGLATLQLNAPFKQAFTAKKNRKKSVFVAQKNSKISLVKTFECIEKHLTPEHIIVTDIGDCLFGAADLTLEQDSFISGAYYASLGFGIPGAVGAQLAAPKRRVIGIIGDGAFQFTCLELSTALRYALDPIIILLNNHGYGTERPLLEGEYNDIQEWNYTEISRFLGGGMSLKASNEEEFENALTNALSNRGKFHLIEVPLDKMDFSPALKRLGSLAKH